MTKLDANGSFLTPQLALMFFHKWRIETPNKSENYLCFVEMNVDQHKAWSGCALLSSGSSTIVSDFMGMKIVLLTDIDRGSIFIRSDKGILAEMTNLPKYAIYDAFFEGKE